MIEIEGLIHVYRTGLLGRKVRALDGITLDVRAGETFGFLGPNGAGKTTTIRVLLGFVRPTAGRVRVLGGAPGARATRRRLGFMPEQPYFYDYLTGAELIRYLGQLQGVPRADLAPRVLALLDELDIARAVGVPLRRYSKGMLQRLGLVQALVNDPELVLLDEPMSGLDPMGRKQVRDLIQRLRREGRTVFFSTHILSDVETVADRVAILARGRVVGLGTLDELLAGRPERVEVCASGLGASATGALAALASAHVAQGDRVLFTIDDRTRADEAIRRVAASGGRVESVSAHRGTLEELFVERVTTPPPGGRP